MRVLPCACSSRAPPPTPPLPPSPAPAFRSVRGLFAAASAPLLVATAALTIAPPPACAIPNDSIVRSLERLREPSTSSLSSPSSALPTFPSAKSEGAIPLDQYLDRVTDRSSQAARYRATRSTRDPGPSLSEQLRHAADLKGEARAAEATGDYSAAAALYERIVVEAPDLTVAGFDARFRRALVLFEDPARREDALQQVRILAKGNMSGDPEVAAAYAGILNELRPGSSEAETVIGDAMSFDRGLAQAAAPGPRAGQKEPPASYGAVKGWPPRATKALDRLLLLQ